MKINTSPNIPKDQILYQNCIQNILNAEKLGNDKWKFNDSEYSTKELIEIICDQYYKLYNSVKITMDIDGDIIYDLQGNRYYIHIGNHKLEKIS